MKGHVADTIYTNGRVYTMESPESVASAFAVRNGKFVAVGTAEDVETLVGCGTTDVDLEGRTVVPGMTDAHTHIIWASDLLQFWSAIHAPPYDTMEKLLDRLRQVASATPAGQWVRGIGNLMHDQRLREQRYPTRSELDSVSSEHPIVLRLAGHVHILNSAAIQRMGIDNNVEDPPGGSIGRDAGGELDGTFLDAHAVLTLPDIPERDRLNAIPGLAHDHFLKNGVTAIGDVVSDAWHVQAFQALKAEGRLPLRIGYYPVLRDAISLDSVKEFTASSGLGDHSLYFAGLKIFADGGISARQGAQYEPYQGSKIRGDLGWSEEEFREVVRTSFNQRIQLIAHAAGDRSFDFVLQIFEEEIVGQGWDNHRFRVEHVSHPYLTDERINRLRDSGSIGVGQAPHFYSMGDFWGRLVGNEKTPLALRQRSMIDAGLTIPGSSDLTGSQPESSNPFLGMWTSITRKAVFGAEYGPDEAITPYEALKSYTIDSAHAINQDDVRGSISAGKLADFCVLDRDVLTVTPDEMLETNVLETFIGGSSVYRK